MAIVVQAMDALFGASGSLVSGIMCSAQTAPKKLMNTERSSTVTAYSGMALSSCVIVCFFTDFDFSVVQMLSSFCMLWAFLLLTMKIEWQNSAAGVSSRMLEMWLVTLFTRLSSTLIKRGYLPEDKSGDYLYQVLDVLIFLVILRLVYTIQRQHRQTYPENDDLHGIFWTIPPCVMLGACFHPTLNRSFMFDTIWTTAQMLETFCMLPQLFMVTKQGGKVETYTVQFVVLMFVSRIFAWLFWYTGYQELADGYIEGVSAGSFNYGGYLIMIMSSIQVLMSADFMYYYAKSLFMGRAMAMPAVTV